MLRVSKLADYGTVVMVYLAHQTQALCNAKEIAAHTHLSLPTVSKILKRLAAAGLLISERGVAGGYRLQRKPADISVAHIVYALEEHKGFTECSLSPNDCSLQAVCSVQGNWRLIGRAIENALASVSLEALAKPLQAKDLQKIQQVMVNLA